MSNLHERISMLCKEKDIKPARMLKEAGVSVNLMSELKSGRKQTITAPIAQKIASYFGVSVSYLLGDADEKKQPPRVLSGLSEDEQTKLLTMISKLDAEDRLALKKYVEFLLAAPKYTVKKSRHA